MVDAYTKVILTVIAGALVWIGLQPLVKPDVARAALDTVRIEGIVQVESAWLAGVKVDCVNGCK